MGIDFTSPSKHLDVSQMYHRCIIECLEGVIGGNKMKKFIVLAVLLMFVASASAVTCDGDIDVMKIQHWQAVNMEKIIYPVKLSSGGIEIRPVMRLTLANPDQTAKIKTVVLIFPAPNMLTSYSYIKDGVRYDFEYNPELDRFVQQ